MPATSANLGPGFDCLGMALNLYNYLEVWESDSLEIEVRGQGHAQIPTDARNLTYQAMRQLFMRVGEQMPPYRLIQYNKIPMSRGLGSSATAIVSGLVAANELIKNPLERNELLEMAADMEGHPDNVTPCMLGGLTVSERTETGIVYLKSSVSSKLRFVALIPSFALSTESARAVLPDVYPKHDVIHSIARASFMFAGLERGNQFLLRQGCQDVLHQPYRKGLIRGWDDVMQSVWDAGAYAAFLSGAGPSILCIYSKHNTSFVQQLQYSLPTDLWQVRKLSVQNAGAKIIQEPTGHAN